MSVKVCQDSFGKKTVSLSEFLKGDTVLIVSGNVVPKRNKYTIQIEKDIHIMPHATAGKYLNHSCDPNLMFTNKQTMVALKGIKKNEELSFDYSTTEDFIENKFKCNCGSVNCRGNVLGRLEV